MDHLMDKRCGIDNTGNEYNRTTSVRKALLVLRLGYPPRDPAIACTGKVFVRALNLSPYGILLVDREILCTPNRLFNIIRSRS
jgi:hypothetical protein